MNLSRVFHCYHTYCTTRDRDVDVPLPEEPEGMSRDQLQGWLTEDAFFTVSPGARQVRQRKEVKMNQLTLAEQREFLKSMDTEWPCPRIWQPKCHQKKQLAPENVGQIAGYALGSFVKARQRGIWTWRQGTTHRKGFHRSCLDIESHSPTLTRDGFMTVLQSVCSHGHKLQFGDVQQAFHTGDSIKRKHTLFVRMPPDGVSGNLVMSGYSCSRQ